MRVFLTAFFFLLTLFHGSFAVDSIRQDKTVEDEAFWSRTLMDSMSMSMAGNQAYFSGATCYRSCKQDNDCILLGGYSRCNKCGKYAGARYYHLCYDPSTPAPTPPPHNYFPNGQKCKERCTSDKDCQPGGVVMCPKCGTTPGTAMYGLCYSPE